VMSSMTLKKLQKRSIEKMPERELSTQEFQGDKHGHISCSRASQGSKEKSIRLSSLGKNESATFWMSVFLI